MKLPDSRQLRTSTPSAAMHKYTAWLVARRAGQPRLPCSQRREELLIIARRSAVIYSQGRVAGMAVRAARERTSCRTRDPAGVLEMLARSPAVQKAAGLLSRSCRNRREQEGPPPTGRSRTWPGNFSSPPSIVYHIF
jgi:hypothetical protein